jgi:hypothetical protein
MNNASGFGTTLATVIVDRGSTFVSSVVISSGSIAPTLSGLSLSSSSIVFGASAPTITAPTSESAGAITYTSSNINVATISGSTITIVGVGLTTITATQAANGNYSSATTTTSLTVTASTVATLSSLTIASGTLSPVFASGTISYSASVSNATTTVTVTPTVTNSNSTVKVNGVTVASGVASGAISLNVGANTITTVVTAQDETTTKTYTITVTRAAPTYETTNLIINYDATSFSNNGIWTNSGTGGAAYNGVVTGSIPVVNSPSTTNNPTALSISNQTNTRTNYIDTGYSANDTNWTIEIIAKAPGGGSGNSIIRKEKQAGATTGDYWIGVQGAAYYHRGQASRGADGSFHVLTFTSEGRIYVDGTERQGATGSNVTPSGNILIVTDLFSEGGHTWQLSRFKYYKDKVLTPAQITSNSSQQKTELGF